MTGNALTHSGYKGRAAFAFRPALLFTALLIYAYAGSPTPDRLSWPEIAIGMLLILALSPASFRLERALFQTADTSKKDAWLRAGTTLLLFGLSVPLLTALLHGNAPGTIMRDMIPFLFMMMPVIYYPLFRRGQNGRLLIAAALAIGLYLSLRALVPFMSGFFQTSPDNFLIRPAGPFSYLANSPMVLFTAIYLAGLAGVMVFKNFTIQNGAQALILTGLAAPPLIIMAMTLQRASLGLFALSLIILTGLSVCKAPKRSLNLLIPMAIAAYLGFPYLIVLTEALYQKTLVTGLNMRAEELAAVWQHISASPLKLLFGTGWGGQFISPVLSGHHSSFTHSLLTSMLLKTGLTGLGLTAIYITGLAGIVWRCRYNAPVFVAAVLPPLIITVLLYASYKSLGFGLLLLLTAFAGKNDAPSFQTSSHR